MMTNRLLFFRASRQHCGGTTTTSVTTPANPRYVINHHRKVVISRRLLCTIALTTTALSASYTHAFTSTIVANNNNKLWFKKTSPFHHTATTFSQCHLNPLYRSSLVTSSSVATFATSTTTATTDADSTMTKDEKEMTRDALAIIKEAIHAVDPQTAVNNYVQALDGSLQFGSSPPYDVGDYDNVLILAFGKASSAMAKATVEKVRLGFGTSIPISGVVIVKDDHATKEELEFLMQQEQQSIHVREASHPVPDERSFEAAQEIMSMAAKATDRTLVLCCISGGGSALFCHPYSQFLSLHDLKQVNQCLLSSGMTINEMNVIRKRLEDGKGGRLAATAYPATVVSLVLSDILGDPLDLIASGPTVPDSSTFEDAHQLIQKYNLQNELPTKVLDMIQLGINGQIDDSPSENHPAFSSSDYGKNNKRKQCETVLVGNNELAVTAAAIESQKRGYHPIVLGTRIEGEAKHIAGMYVAMAQHLVASKERETTEGAAPFTMSPLPVALIGGGETTVTLGNDHGKGGRNQELALAAALQLKSLSLRNVVLASAGTDGTDGPTDAAGAVVDGGLVDRKMPSMSAEEYLQNHDAYNYFCSNDTNLSNDHEDIDSPLIMTGPTGTNVADVCVTLIR